MVPATLDALLIIGLVIVPGYLFLLILRVALLDQTAPVRAADPLQLFLVIALGMLLLVIAFPAVTLPVVEYYRAGAETIASNATDIAVRVFVSTFVWL
ncbi:MAG: hypothetical protein H0V24_05260 [Chloroflexia bacterium]|nr:hypothetical protein [Chloroflexia bacterium]